VVAKKTNELEEKLAQAESNWKRALADYQNLEKRTREQNGMMALLAGLSIIEKLVPLMDHLILADKHLNDPGLAMVTKQLNDILKSEGVTVIEAMGKPFDPHLMECIEQIEGDKDSVLEVIADGYRMGDRVIRPAKVKVGKGN
jgi:molecular chaperone GrpE